MAFHAAGVNIPWQAACRKAEAHACSLRAVVEVETVQWRQWHCKMCSCPQGWGCYCGTMRALSTRELRSNQVPRPTKQELKHCHEGAESCGHSPWKHHQKELFRAKCIPCVGPAHVFLVNWAALPGFRRVSVWNFMSLGWEGALTPEFVGVNGLFWRHNSGGLREFPNAKKGETHSPYFNWKLCFIYRRPGTEDSPEPFFSLLSESKVLCLGS